MVLKKVGVLSCGKVLGAFSALIGLMVGAIFTLFALLGMPLGPGTSQAAENLLEAIFRGGAIIYLPLIFGVLGLVKGLIGALLYNLVARFVGGLDLELE